MWRIFPLVVASLVGAAAEGASQSAKARDELSVGLAALAAGDTASGLARIRSAIALSPDFAEAHFRLGLIHAHRARGEPPDYAERLRADRSLAEAVRQDPQNPLYMLEYAKILLLQQIRVDARRALEQTLSLAELAADPETLAETHYQLGLYYEREWIRLRRSVSEFGAVAAGSEDGGIGFINKEQMLDHLFAALSAQPEHQGAASHILAYLFDEGQREQYLMMAEDFAERLPSAALSHLLLGLGLTWHGQLDAATEAFEQALELMPAIDRLRYEAGGPPLPPELEQTFASLPDSARSEIRRRVWARADPLYLTPANEAWLDHMARLAYNEVRLGVVGHQPYGPAGYAQRAWQMRLAGLDPDDESSPIPRVGRSGAPGELTASSLPARYSVPVQAARFRGSGGHMALELHALLPLNRLVEHAAVQDGDMEFGLFVWNAVAEEVHREVRVEEMDFREGGAERLSSWRIELPAESDYSVSVEAREPLTWHAAAGRLEVESRSFGRRTLEVSDLLLADTVLPPPDPDRNQRDDFRVTPNPRMAYGTQQPIALYFEVYDLVPAEDGFVAYEVELVFSLDRIERGPQSILEFLVTDIADRWGFTPVGTDAAQVRFEKQARVQAQEAYGEYFHVQLPGAPAGDYTLKLKVRDLVSGHETGTERGFVIRETR